MSTLVIHSSNLFLRQLRGLLRQPFWLVVQLTQPLIWLLLFGSLFRGVAELPGFEGSFMTHMAPGMVIMLVMFSASWSGATFIEDMNRGVMNRFLVSPASRLSLLLGSLGYLSVTLSIQSLVVLGIGKLMGAEYAGGFVGILVTLFSAVMLAFTFGSMSNSLALLLRKFESVMAVGQFLAMPMIFTSSALMDLELAPGWMRTVARYNPVDWAVVASRGALSADPDWSVILRHVGGLVLLASALVWLSTRAFRAYQRSV